jgi:sterol 3beta-glucosyltransferase
MNFWQWLNRKDSAMHIVILTVGSRGDVQPYIALAKGLMARGHQVTLGASKNFETFVTSNGVAFRPINADYYQLIDTPEGKAMMSGNPIRIVQNLRTVITPMIRQTIESAWQAAQGADFLIYHPKVLIGADILEKLQIKGAMAVAAPVISPTGAFPAPGLPSLPFGAAFNRFTYRLVASAGASFGGTIKAWRESVGLPAKSKVIKSMTFIHNKRIPVLYPISSSVLPRPDDYPDNAYLTGYWFLDQPTWTPPHELVEFLGSGTKPIYIGFGSMVGQNPQHTTQVILEAIEKAGVRAVLASGWGGLSDTRLPESVYLLKEAPHEWLFPRAAAVVHHGGAGTVAAGLRAGKPTIVVPFIADQPFWGRVLVERGVSPATLPEKSLNASTLAAAIQKMVNEPHYRQKAEEIAEAIAHEDGIGNAVTIIESLSTASS